MIERLLHGQALIRVGAHEALDQLADLGAERLVAGASTAEHAISYLLVQLVHPMESRIRLVLMLVFDDA